MLTICSHCQQDSAGQHEFGCPLRTITSIPWPAVTPPPKDYLDVTLCIGGIERTYRADLDATGDDMVERELRFAMRFLRTHPNLVTQ